MIIIIYFYNNNNNIVNFSSGAVESVHMSSRNHFPSLGVALNVTIKNS